jgi:RHS repeat-associated protein
VLGQKIEEWDAGTTDEDLHTVYAYNQLDQLTSESRPMTSDNGVVTSIVKTYARDLAGRVTSLTLADDPSPIQQTTYNTLGMVLSVTSSPGLGYADIVNSYTYDAAGRMVTEQDGAASVWTYTYNAQGLPAVTYDPLYVESGGYATRLAYDLEGRLTDKLVATEGPSPQVSSFVTLAYNAFSEVTQKTYSVPDADPASETYTYEAHTGRLTQVTCAGGVVLGYSNFDAASRPQQLTYEIPGIGQKTEYVTYYANGALASLTLPGQEEMTYTYNEEKRLAQVRQGTSDAYTFTYDDRGLAEKVSYPTAPPAASLDLALTWTLDGRPASLALTATDDGQPPATTTLASLDYAYNAYGRVASIEREDSQIDHQATGAQSFTWDRLGRLAACDSSHTGSDEDYAWDARSNLGQKRKGDIVGGQMTAASTTTFTHDDAGRIETETKGAAETAYHYDPAGRLTSKTSGPAALATYTWNGADRLISAQENAATVDYLYDSSGRMLSRTQGTTHAAFLPAGATQEAGLVYGWEGQGTPEVSYSYVQDPSGTRLAQTDYATGGTVTTYPFRDPRGDVLDLASPDGSLSDAYAYTPFGEMEDGFSPDGTPFLYQDDYRDPATELYQMQARWYDPNSARFLSLDPKMGDASDPLRRLPYAYCAGDPVYNSDPSGASFLSGVLDFARGIVSAITGNTQGNNPRYANMGKASRRAMGGIKGTMRNIERGLSLAAKSLTIKPTTVVRSGNWSAELDIRFPTDPSEREALIESLNELAETESGREILSQLDINKNGKTTIHLSYKNFGIQSKQKFGETSESFGEKFYNYSKRVGRWLVSPIWGINGDDTKREFDVSMHSKYMDRDPRAGAVTLAHELQHAVNMRDNKSMSKGYDEMTAYRTENKVFMDMARGALGRPLGIEHPWVEDPFMRGAFYLDSRQPLLANASNSDMGVVERALGLNSENDFDANFLDLERNNITVFEGFYDDEYLINYFEARENSR